MICVVILVPVAWGKSLATFDVLRFADFLCLACLAWLAAGAQGLRLVSDPIARPVRITSRAGQQALANLMVSGVLARLPCIVPDTFEHGLAVTGHVNIPGMALITAVAYRAACIRAAPWKNANVTTPHSQMGQRMTPVLPQRVPACR